MRSRAEMTALRDSVLALAHQVGGLEQHFPHSRFTSPYDLIDGLIPEFPENPEVPSEFDSEESFHLKDWRAIIEALGSVINSLCEVHESLQWVVGGLPIISTNAWRATQALKHLRQRDAVLGPDFADCADQAWLALIFLLVAQEEGHILSVEDCHRPLGADDAANRALLQRLQDSGFIFIDCRTPPDAGPTVILTPATIELMRRALEPASMALS